MSPINVCFKQAVKTPPCVHQVLNLLQVYCILSPPAPSQAIIFSHLTQTLWSGYVLTCKDGRWVGAGDLIMSAVAWGGMLAGNGAEIRAAGSLLGRWDREGKKPSTLAALSAPLSTTNPLFSPPHSKYMFSLLWRGVKKRGVSEAERLERQWGRGFLPGEFRREAMTGFVKKPWMKTKSKFMFKLMNCLVLRILFTHYIFAPWTDQIFAACNNPEYTIHTNESQIMVDFL